MPLSLYQVTIPPFIHSLQVLSTLLSKASTSSPTLDPNTLLSSRLIPDMAALPYQIQRASDTAKGVAVRVAHISPVTMPDTETTFAELQERIAKTIALLEGVDPAAMDGREEEEVVFRMQSGERRVTATKYVQSFAVPNFYFHVCMAYALLRKEGVQIGKLDYLGAV